MSRPTPEPLSPEEAQSFALAVMGRSRFPALATCDGDQPCARPVSPVRTEGFTVHIANLKRYGKTRQIAANPKVELCYVDSEHNQVRITGCAVVETDKLLLSAIWDASNLLRAFLSRPDHPDLIVYRVEPERVRCMKEWALEYTEVDPVSAAGLSENE